MYNRIRVDTTPPRIESFTARPLVISPDGDGRSDRAKIRYRVSERATVELYVDGYVAYRPSAAVELQLIPAWGTQVDTDQYVLARTDAAAAATFGRRYVFADVRQDDFYLGLRADWTLRPDLSLQLYLSPGVTTDRFRGFKELRAPRTYDFTVFRLR